MMNNSQGASSFFSGLSTLLGRPHPLLHNLSDTTGTSDRYFRAFDARTGEILWQQRTNSGVIGVPSTYMVDGVQYIAVQSGWGVDAAAMGRRIDGARGTSNFVPQGGVVWVFALRR